MQEAMMLTAFKIALTLNFLDVFSAIKLLRNPKIVRNVEDFSVRNVFLIIFQQIQTMLNVPIKTMKKMKMKMKMKMMINYVSRF